MFCEATWLLAQKEVWWRKPPPPPMSGRGLTPFTGSLPAIPLGTPAELAARVSVAVVRCGRLTATKKISGATAGLSAACL